MKEFKKSPIYKKIVGNYEELDSVKLRMALEDAFTKTPNGLVVVNFANKFDYVQVNIRQCAQIFIPCTWFDELVYLCGALGLRMEEKCSSTLVTNVSFFAIGIDFSVN